MSIHDSAGDSATVASSATVGQPPLTLTPVPITADAATALNNVTVATFTDAGIAGAGASGPASQYTSQFTASIDWGDGTAATVGTITFNSTTGVFSIQGSHTYATTGNYSINVTLTPQTISVSLIDSSDPTGLTKAPSAEFIEQLNPSTANQTIPISILGLPTVATTSGNFALTVSAQSPSESRLHLSVNGEYLVLAGYNSTVASTSDQGYLDPPSQVYRVIGTINGESAVNTTTALSDASYLDNFRGAVSVNGTSFYTYGSADNLYGQDQTSTGFARYVGSAGSVTTSTAVTNVDYDNNGLEIFNNTLYDAIRSPKTGSDLSGIYVIGTPGTLPTTANQTSTLFIQVPQTNPFEVNDGNKTTSPYDFWMTDLSSNPNSVNGVNVAYIADGMSGIARYDYNGTSWNFSYYISSTGTFDPSTYTVGANGQLSIASPYSANNLPPVDTSLAGGVTGLTGEIVNGQVELFAVTGGVGYGSIKNAAPANKVIEVTDTGINSTYTTLATAGSNAEYRGVSLSPWAAVSSSAQVTVVSVTNPGTQNSTVDQAVSLPIQASGLPTGATWSYAATGLPAGLAINTSTGIISGKITGNPSVYSVLVSASNGQGNSATQTFSWKVSALGTLTTLTAAPQGGAVLFTATVSANPALAAPVGSVTFKIDGVAQSTTNLVNGVASFTVTSLSPGPHTITAVFNGSTDFLTSTASLTQGASTLLTTPLVVSYFAIGAGDGTSPQVNVYNVKTDALVASFYAFDPGFGGGVNVAVADVNGDGPPDIICAAGASGGPQVVVIDGTKLNQVQTNGEIASSAILKSFDAFAAGFQGGVTVAAGDVDADGRADIVCGAGAGGGPQVTVWSGKTFALLDSFYALASTFTGGIRVAAGDVDGDGFADVITAAGPGGLAQVSVFSGNGLRLLESFYAFANFGGGAYVAAGDMNGDGRADIVVGEGPSGEQRISAFNGLDGSPLFSFLDPRLSANPSGGLTTGIRVSAAPVNGHPVILATSGTGSPPLVDILNAQTQGLLDEFFAFNSSFLGGVYLGS